MFEELLELSISTIMDLWAELVECYHRVNGYGGNTAEIYAYRLFTYSPQYCVAKNELREAEEGYKASERLLELCQLFAKKYDCKVYIDNIELEEYNERYHCLTHRANVRVERKQNT